MGEDEIRSSINVTHQTTYISNTDGLEKANKKIKEQEELILALRLRIDELKEELANSEDAGFMKDLEERVKAAEKALTAALSSISSQFEAFKQAFNLDMIEDKDLAEWTQKVATGTMSLSEAMSRTKERFKELIQAGGAASGGGGGGPGDWLQVLLTKIDEVLTSLGELKSKLENVKTGAGGSAIADAAATAGTLAKAVGEVGDEAAGSTKDLTGFVAEIVKLSQAGDRSLFNLSSIFKGLGEISHGGIGEKTVTNVANLASAMQDMGGSGTIRVDFSGFKDLKISKASMSNLAEYLPKIANVNVDNLIKLSDVDLSKFNNLKISKGAVEELAKIADAVKIFQAIPSVSTGVGDAGIKIDTAGSGLGDIKDNLLTLAKTTTTFYEEGKKEVKEYANAQGDVVARIIRTTNAKGEESIVTEKVNNIRKRETEETNKATRAAELYDKAMRQVGDAIKYNRDATGSEVSAIKDQKAAIDDLYNSFLGKQGYSTIAAGDLDAFKKGVAEALHSTTTAVKDNKAAVAENKRETTEAARAQETYKKAIYEANEALSRRSATLGDRGVQSKAYADIQAQAQAIKDLYAGYATGNVGYDEFTTRMASALRNLRSATKDYTEEQKQELEVERQLQSARNDAAKSIESGKQALAEYAAVANKAKNRDAYTNLRSNIAAYDELDRKLEAGTISAEEYIEKTRQLDSEIKKNTNTLKQNENAHSALGAKLKSVVAMYFSFTRVVSYAVRAVREMVQASMELDKALTQMQIVTGANNAEMERFADTAFEAAGRAASNITDIISGATTYARLGFDTQTSTALAEYTAMLQNVGDINAQDAQDAITAIIKAFDGVDETNIKEKLDELVVVGRNNCPGAW